MNYENYHLEDFLQDEEFKRWVQNPDTESEIFWKNWLISHPNQRETILKARELLLALDFEATVPDEEDYKEVLLNILKGEASTSMAQKQVGARPNYFANLHTMITRLAGVIIILIATLVVYIQTREQPVPLIQAPVKYITKENPRGQKSQISLPDGTVLWLNSESRLTYPEKFTARQRIVELKGEAFFEVAKEHTRPFVVQMNNLHVVALGTSFNISAFPEDQNVAVSLVSGKVLVKENISTKDLHKPHFEDVVLAPGEKLLYDLQDFSIRKSYYDFKSDIVWKDGTIYFENASFREVKNKLERWFNVKIILKNGVGQQWNYSGEFQRESLDRILQRIGFVEGFEFQQRDHEVIIIYEN